MQDDRSTVAEALRELRKPGKVYAQALVTEDVTWLQAVKADVVWRLEQYVDRTAPAPWWIERDDDGDMYLHTY